MSHDASAMDKEERERETEGKKHFSVAASFIYLACSQIDRGSDVDV